MGLICLHLFYFLKSLFYYFFFIQQVLISYLFYIYYCIYVNPNLPIQGSFPFFSFLSTQCAIRDLSSLTRDGTHTFIFLIGILDVFLQNFFCISYLHSCFLGLFSLPFLPFIELKFSICCHTHIVFFSLQD